MLLLKINDNYGAYVKLFIKWINVSDELIDFPGIKNPNTDLNSTKSILDENY